MLCLCLIEIPHTRVINSKQSTEFNSLRLLRTHEPCVPTIFNLLVDSIKQPQRYKKNFNQQQLVEVFLSIILPKYNSCFYPLRPNHAIDLLIQQLLTRKNTLFTSFCDANNQNNLRKSIVRKSSTLIPPSPTIKDVLGLNNCHFLIT